MTVETSLDIHTPDPSEAEIATSGRVVLITDSESTPRTLSAVLLYPQATDPVAAYLMSEIVTLTDKSAVVNSRIKYLSESSDNIRASRKKDELASEIYEQKQELAAIKNNLSRLSPSQSSVPVILIVNFSDEGRPINWRRSDFVGSEDPIWLGIITQSPEVFSSYLTGTP